MNETEKKVILEIRIRTRAELEEFERERINRIKESEIESNISKNKRIMYHFERNALAILFKTCSLTNKTSKIKMH